MHHEKLTIRIRELDRRYLLWDAAWDRWMRCTGGIAERRRLHAEERAAWSHYLRLVNTPVSACWATDVVDSLN